MGHYCLFFERHVRHVCMILFIRSRRQVPQSDLMMSRSHLHCFWHDDPADPQASSHGWIRRSDKSLREAARLSLHVVNDEI